jgi:N-methylhydantoinase A
MAQASEDSRSPIPVAGADVGGTFTDFVTWDGHWHIHKRLSTPHDPSQSIAEGLEELAFEGALRHGSTVATNALLERRGAKAALLTTQGFADVLRIGRQNRHRLYDLAPRKVVPLVPSERCFEVPERLDAWGSVVTALDETAVEAVAVQMRAARVESVAIVFLWSFLNPEHETRAGEILRRVLPDVPVTLSCELLPEFREYERASTCAINAYVAPTVSRYLSRLQARLPEMPIGIMASNGGTLDVATAAQDAARLVLSGPAGGIVGAMHTAHRVGQTRLLTFDMGGTSTDVALLDGALPVSGEGEIIGLPLRLPSLDIHTVGAGGGSIIWIDAGGALRVGPRSAGSSPGPACYGQGGTEPTISDANLVLGRLDAAHFLGGTQTLDETAARLAFEPLAKTLGLTIEAAALGALRIVNAAMERALRRVSTQRGIDPRPFTLFPFGGAGPLHVGELAELLAIRRVLVPRYPGVLSALGMMVADEVRETSRALLLPFDALKLKEVGARLEAMERELQLEGAFEATLELRYAGQSFEIAVPLELPPTETALESARTAFHKAHLARYGYADEARQVEAVTLRLRVKRPGFVPQEPEDVEERQEGAPVGTKTVWFGGGPRPTRCFERDALLPGAFFAGPAIVWQFDTTTIVPPNWKAHVDGQRNLWLEWDPNES